MYHPPEKDHEYVMICDVSRGKGLDYSAFQIIDISKMPYRQVLVFRDNFVAPADFTEIINRLGTMYGGCSVMVEINDIGQQVADMLHVDFEYENLILTENAGSKGKRVTTGMGKTTDIGVRTTKTVKNVGCSLLKLLVEQDQLIIHDHDTISELSTFSRKRNSYEAESGCHDDLAMCLVLFAWFTEQNYFKMLTDINTLMKLREKTVSEVEDDLMPFGFVSNHDPATSIESQIEIDSFGGEVWSVVE
jgi:hypothetical protein